MATAEWISIVGAFVALAATLLFAGLLAALLGGPSGERRHIKAHADALIHLASVLDTGANRSPDPGRVRAQVSAVLEFLEYPKRGRIGDWETRTAAMICGNEDGRLDPWDQAVEALFDFAGVDLYAGFSEANTLAAYEHVRKALRVVGLKAKPTSKLGLGRI